MSQAIGTATIALPIDACWARLRDLSRAEEYVPGVVSCRIQTEQTEGVGTHRTVKHKQTGLMDETVITWDEGHGFTLKLHRGERPPMMFSEATFSYRLEADGENTIVHTQMDYVPAWGAVGSLMDSLFIGAIVASNVRAVARELARFYEAEEAAQT